MNPAQVTEEVLMQDDTGRPKRVRYSFETRCRAVAEMLAGVSPEVAVGARRATGYRWLGRCRAPTLAYLERAELGSGPSLVEGLPPVSGVSHLCGQYN